jgi:hypothetical protein
MWCGQTRRAICIQTETLFSVLLYKTNAIVLFVLAEQSVGCLGLKLLSRSRGHKIKICDFQELGKCWRQLYNTPWCTQLTVCSCISTRHSDCYCGLVLACSDRRLSGWYNSVAWTSSHNITYPNCYSRWRCVQSKWLEFMLQLHTTFTLQLSRH